MRRVIYPGRWQNFSVSRAPFFPQPGFSLYVLNFAHPLTNRKEKGDDKHKKRGERAWRKKEREEKGGSRSKKADKAGKKRNGERRTA